MGTNVFTADADRNLVFINKNAKETLKAVAGEIRKSFNVDANNLQGMSIHSVHGDPDRIEKILLDPANLPHNAQVELGDQTLDLMVRPSRRRPALG